MKNELALIQPLEEFVKGLHRKPVAVMMNEMTKTEFIPISAVEMTLDEMFYGLWQTGNFRTRTVANEIVGEIDLQVFHPVAKVWITRTGAAAVQIQMKSEKNGGTGNITDIGQKIKNTLVKDYPHLKAECIKNAAKSLGALFGRDLARKFFDSYQPQTEQDSERIMQITEIETLVSERELTEKQLTAVQYLDSMDKIQLEKIIVWLKDKPRKGAAL